MKDNRLKIRILENEHATAHGYCLGLSKAITVLKEELEEMSKHEDELRIEIRDLYGENS